MPAARPTELTYPSWAEIDDKWLVFNGHIYQVRMMLEDDIMGMIATLTTKPIRTELELHTITDYSDEFSRRYVAVELQRKRLLVLYDTQVEAEQALLPLPMPQPMKRRKSKKAS